MIQKMTKEWFDEVELGEVIWVADYEANGTVIAKTESRDGYSIEVEIEWPDSVQLTLTGTDQVEKPARLTIEEKMERLTGTTFFIDRSDTTFYGV